MPEKRVILLLAACSVLLAACGGFGKVNQGRVVEFDLATGVLTVISDPLPQERTADPFGVLPPVTVHVPTDPHQMGPAPQAGKLIALDAPNRRVVIFDASAQSFKTISYTLVEQRENVYANDPAVRGGGLPRIDREKKTVTLYSAEHQLLVTFSVPDNYIDMPADTWVLGDEVRYYYKDPQQALRLMNVTKTGI